MADYTFNYIKFKRGVVIEPNILLNLDEQHDYDIFGAVREGKKGRCEARGLSRKDLILKLTEFALESNTGIAMIVGTPRLNITVA